MKTKVKKGIAVAAVGLLALLLLSGCSITDPGEGTKSLLVKATLEYKASSNTSSVTVSIKDKKGEPVVDADVGLETKSGKIIRIPADIYSPGYYRLQIRGYENVLTLLVYADDKQDYLNATLEGPGRHIIVSPYHDFVLLSKNEPDLVAKWKNAEEGEVEKVAIRTTYFSDEYNGDIKKAVLDISDLKRGRELLEVARENTVELAGGLSDSIFTMRYIASNEFTVD